MATLHDQVEDYASQKGIDVIRAGYDLGVDRADMLRLFPDEMASAAALEALLKLPRASRVYRTPTVLEPPRAPSPRAPAPPCTVLTRVTVTPLSSHPSAMLATVRTLEMIHGAGFASDPMDDSGEITGTAVNASFLKWAAERQGYVSSVMIHGSLLREDLHARAAD